MAGVVFESVPCENQSGTVSNRQMPVYKTVTDCFSQGILVETVLAYLKLSPQPAKSTVLTKKTNKLTKKHGQQILQGFDML